MNSIKTAGEILTNPIKIQELKLNSLLIKEQKNKWKYIFLSFATGVITSFLSIFFSNLINEPEKDLGTKTLLSIVHSQTETIKELSNEINVLKNEKSRK